MFLWTLNILGTIAFAVAGSLKGLKYKLDILGVIILGIITAVGGGICRDVLINKIPVVFIEKETIFVAIITAFLTYTFGYHIKDFSKVIKIFDALGLAVFAVVGAQVAMDFSLNIVGVVFLSTITATFGGMFRDILVNEIPFILKEEVYATFCIIGAIIYFYMDLYIPIDKLETSYFVLAFIFIGRLISLKYDLHMPRKDNLQLK
ncbi:MAG: trimeric intracellular cation channel family protein [Fusobacteriota bacterium]